MDRIELISKKSCQYHANVQSRYLFICKNEMNLIPICSICAKQKDAKYDQLILNEECLSNDESNIITNWPPLDDKSLELSMFNYLMHSKSTYEMAEERAKFFSKVKDDIISVINRIQKIDFQFNHEDILSVYNEISQKDLLKRFLINEDDDNSEIKQQISQIISNSTQNKRIVENVLKKNNLFYQIADIKTFEGLFASIQAQLEQFLQLFDHNQTHQTITQSAKEVKKLEENKINQIMQIINLYNQKQDQLLEKIQISGESTQERLIQIKKKLLKIQTNQIDTINNQLTCSQIDGIFSNRVDLEPFRRVSLLEHKLFYFDQQINPEHLGIRFRLKITSLNQWMGVGIVNISDVAARRQTFSGILQKNLYYYLISANGVLWNQEENPPQANTSFKFSESDIIEVKVKTHSIKFTKNQNEEVSRIKFNYDFNKKYHLCYFLTPESDSIELLD